MATSAIKHGVPIVLQELRSPSPFLKQDASLRVTGSMIKEYDARRCCRRLPFVLLRRQLQAYSVENAIAVIIDEGVSLKVDTQHLRDISFQIGSMYQFIGEILIQSDNDAVLRARVGRNVDGIDLNLYHESLLLRRKFEADLANPRPI